MLPPDLTLHNRYRVLYVLDERPGSKIYRARDEQSGRLVLIAELSLPYEDAREDLARLARQVAAVQHEALLPLTDHFATQEGYYLVCEDPAGQDLERALRARGGPLPEAETLIQARRLLNALESLHSQPPPLYLGDPLPGDIYIVEDGTWRLTPFMLARPIGQTPSPYRAPELADRESEPTAASDLYALSALLYQALTGWAPPSADQQQAGTPLNSPRALNPGLSALAEQALLRGLQLRPANRYQAAREMRMAFETVTIMGGRSFGLGPDALVSTSGAGILPASAPAPTSPAATAASPSLVMPGSDAAQPAPSPADAAPPQRRLSTGCAVALAVTLTLLVVAVCIGLLLFVPGSPLRGFLAARGIAPFASAPTAAPTTAATTATSAPSLEETTVATTPLPTIEPAQLGPRAITLQNAGQITQTQMITGAVFGPVAFAPDGKTLAIGVSNVVDLRDAETLEDRRQLDGHTGKITSLAWSPDGQLLASGASDDQVVRLWDGASGQLTREFRGHGGWIRSLAFSPNGELLASGSTDMTIRLWDASNGMLLQTLEGHTDLIGGVAFSPDGATLVSASRDGTVRLWDVATGAPREEFSFQAPIDPASNTRYWTTGVAFAPDGKTIAVGATNGIVYLLDAATGDDLRALRGHTDWIVIRGVLFAPDGERLLTASLDGTIRSWDPGTGDQVEEFQGHRLNVFGITVTADGERLASASDEEGRLLIWDVASARVENSLSVGQGLVTALMFSPDSALLASVGFNGAIRLHQLEQDRVRVLAGSSNTNQSLALLPGDQIAAITDQGSIVVVGIEEREEQSLEGLTGDALSIAASPDGTLVAAGSSSGQILLWNVATSRMKQGLNSSLDAVVSLAFSSDGTLLAAGGPPGDPQIEIWDLTTGRRRHSLTGPTNTITALAFQPRGTLIAATDLDGSLRLWDAQSGQPVRTIEAAREQGWFAGLAFAPDGTMLATGSPNGDLQFWNVGTGEEVARLTLQPSGVLALAFSPDGQRLAVSARDLSMRIFTLPGD